LYILPCIIHTSFFMLSSGAKYFRLVSFRVLWLSTTDNDLMWSWTNFEPLRFCSRRCWTELSSPSFYNIDKKNGQYFLWDETRSWNMFIFIS
jgi:hypothetical protein